MRAARKWAAFVSIGARALPGALSRLTSPPSHALSAIDQRLFSYYLGHLGEGDDSRHDIQSYKGAVSNEY
jgi:hypothetical protein